jgi:hypothetical protein
LAYGCAVSGLRSRVLRSATARGGRGHEWDFLDT